MKDTKQEWKETDELWELLGKAAPKEASDRFADNTLRAVRLLPEADPWWSKVVKFSPVAAAAACVVFGAAFLAKGTVRPETPESVAEVTTEERWDQIEKVADAEMISAAVDHLDDFSDEDLIVMIGF